MNVQEFVRNRESIDLEEHSNKVLESIKKIDKEYHYMNALSDVSGLNSTNAKSTKGKIRGLPITLKDCIVVKGMISRSGSKILDGYNPLFDATSVERIKNEGGVIFGKTAQDEFGFGGFSANVGIDFQVPLNPFDKERACGGSSGGSGGITQKLEFPHLSIAESTGGSIVAPASFCGVYGLSPTYGRVSRYGLIDYANSLDKIGPMGKDIFDIALALEIISGFDSKDATSLSSPVEPYTDSVGAEVKGMSVGLIKTEGIDPTIQNSIDEYTSKLESAGVKVSEVALPTVEKFGVPSYYLAAVSEASTNLAKYCGMRYGKSEKLEGSFNEYFSKVRSANLGSEAKRRIILGTFARMAGYRDAYYIKAMKVRTLMINEYKSIFKKHDALLSPTMPLLPPKFSDLKKLSPLELYSMDQLTVGPNMAGLPHLNVPIDMKKGLPVGALLISDHLKESTLIRLGGVK